MNRVKTFHFVGFMYTNFSQGMVYWLQNCHYTWMAAAFSASAHKRGATVPERKEWFHELSLLRFWREQGHRFTPR